MPKPRGSRASPPSARPSSGGAAWCQWTTLRVDEDRDGEAANANALADRGLMALAGLWETWRSPAGGFAHKLNIIEPFIVQPSILHKNGVDRERITRCWLTPGPNANI
jgi:hypothetical protein